MATATSTTHSSQSADSDPPESYLSCWLCPAEIRELYHTGSHVSLEQSIQAKDDEKQNKYINIPKGLGVFQESTYQSLERYRNQYLCMGCRKGRIYSMVTCEQCLEYQYCSMQCMENYSHRHSAFCTYIGFKKGFGIFSYCRQISTSLDILSSAKTLDELDDILVFDNLLTASNSTTRVAQLTDQSFLEVISDQEQNKTLPVSVLETYLSQLDKLRNGPVIYFKVNDKFSRETRQQIAGAIVRYQTSKGNFGRSETEAVHDDECKFGQGWWKMTSHLNMFGCGKFQYFQKEKSPRVEPFSSERPKLKYSDFYSDSDSDVEKDEDSGRDEDRAVDHSNSEQRQTDSAAAHPSSGRTSPERELPLSIHGHMLSQIRRTLNFGPESCAFCHEEYTSMKVCSKCHFATYCSKECQREHYRIHKHLCKTQALFREMENKIPPLVKDSFVFKYPGTDVTCNSLEIPTTLPDFLMFFQSFLPTMGVHFFGQIVSVKHCWPGCVVRLKDSEGNVAVALLVFSEVCTYFHTPDFGEPIFIADCLVPGNFVLIPKCLWDIAVNCIFTTRGAGNECFFILNRWRASATWPEK